MTLPILLRTITLAFVLLASPMVAFGQLKAEPNTWNQKISYDGFTDEPIWIAYNTLEVDNHWFTIFLNCRSRYSISVGLVATKPSSRHLIPSVRPKTGDFAVVRCRRRVFSRRILRRVGIFSKKSSPSRAEKAASRDVGGLRATPKRPTSRVGYQNRNRPRLRGHQTSSTASTRFASQTLSFLTLQ